MLYPEPHITTKENGMNSFSRHRIRRASLLAAAILSALALGACAEDKGSETGDSGSAGSSAEKDKLVADAKAFVERAAAKGGTAELPDATPRPAATDKTLVIVAFGLNNQSEASQVAGITEACKAIEWSCSVLDGQSDPTKYAGLVRQATAQKPDGIVISGIDCETVSQPLKEALDANIAVFGEQAFDCDLSGGKPLFSAAQIFPNVENPAGKPVTFLQHFKDYGTARAQVIIAGTDGDVNLTVLTNTEASVLKVSYVGFKAAIEKLPGSKIEETEVTFADLGPKLEGLTTSALLRNKGATAFAAPFDGAYTSGAGSAIEKSGRKKNLFVMGVEAIPTGLDLVRKGTVNAELYEPGNWHGWSIIDVANSYFTKVPVVNSGLGFIYVDKTHNLPAKAGESVSDDLLPDYK